MGTRSLLNQLKRGASQQWRESQSAHLFAFLENSGNSIFGLDLRKNRAREALHRVCSPSTSPNADSHTLEQMTYISMRHILLSKQLMSIDRLGRAIGL
jgi:hypothetical protein